jgi:hypothetical protein
LEKVLRIEVRLQLITDTILSFLKSEANATCFHAVENTVEIGLGRGHTKKSGNRNATAIFEKSRRFQVGN